MVLFMETTNTLGLSRWREPYCPSWCAGHGAGVQPWETTATRCQEREHAGETATVAGVGVTLVQLESEARVMAPALVALCDGGDLLLTESDAHELGLALVRAAERLRRERLS